MIGLKKSSTAFQSRFTAICGTRVPHSNETQDKMMIVIIANGAGITLVGGQVFAG